MIYADENVWLPVVTGLRSRGWEVTTARDEGTLGYSDEDHLEYAARREWVLMTFDDDFLSLVQTEYEEGDHPGIIFVSQHGKNVGQLVKRIDLTLQHHEKRTLEGEIIFS